MPHLFTLRKMRSWAVLAALAFSLIAADVYQAQTIPARRGKFVPVSLFSGVTAAPARVSIVRSDDDALPDPASTSSALTYAQVEAMTRRAVELAGGFDELVRPGDRVLIKPCIAAPDLSGNTDVRVVKAVARLVHEAAGGGRGIDHRRGLGLPHASGDGVRPLAEQACLEAALERGRL